MVDVLQVSSLILAVLAMVPALAHALEMPGKLRLTKDAYFAVQPIYYPGFTVLGVTEPLAIVSTIALLVATLRGSADFWLTLVGLLGLLGMHAVYWLFTHPVNNFWLRNERLTSAGAEFFSLGSSRARGAWTELRDRWEYSHVVRAGLAFLSVLALIIAMSPALDA